MIKAKCCGPVGLTVALAAGLFLVAPASAVTVYSEDFETGAAPGFNFSGSGFWHVTQNAPSSGSYALGYVHDETAGATANGSYAGAANSSAQYNAFGPGILLPSASNITFTFVALNHDEGIDGGHTPNGWDRLSVGVSTNGTTFGTVVASSPPWNGGVIISENNGYHPYSVNLTAFAGQTIYLSFGYYTQDGSFNNYPGARIDDLLITAVPEPESYAMMLAGLGLMGFMARGRKQNQVADSARQ